MLKIFIWGISGKMGRVLADCIEDDPQTMVIGGFDLVEHLVYPTYNSVAQIDVLPDVIIDFSTPYAIEAVCSFASKNNIPLVLAATGYNQEQEQRIADIAKQLPVFKSGNFSKGINTILELVQQAAQKLDDFDIEIVEKHHNQKLDAPSGTALMLAKSANIDNSKELVYDYKTKREKNQIGIHSIRGGTIFGEHDVIFAGQDEIITISHSALSKRIFALGAIKAAKQLMNLPAGLYTRL